MIKLEINQKIKGLFPDPLEIWKERKKKSSYETTIGQKGKYKQKPNNF